MNYVAAVFSFVLAIMSASVFADARYDAAKSASDALGKGVNLGLVFETEKHDDFSKILRCIENYENDPKKKKIKVGCGKYYSIVIRDGFFEGLKNAGFDSVRIPVRWMNKGTIEIRPGLMGPVEAVVKRATEAGLIVILDVHYYEWIGNTGEEKVKNLVELWKKLADIFGNYGVDQLYFEILNEPQKDNAWVNANWKGTILKVVEAIRNSGMNNVERPIVVGALNPNDHKWIKDLPKRSEILSDGPIIAAFHNYDPFEFTHAHQNCRKTRADAKAKAESKEEEPEKCEPLLMSKYSSCIEGSSQEDCWKEKNKKNIGGAVESAEIIGMPLTLGEFGYETQCEGDYQSQFIKVKCNALRKNTRADQAEWIEYMVSLAKENKISWTYWNAFGSFGFIDFDEPANFRSSTIYQKLMSE